MIGYLVRHQQLGDGKIVAAQNNALIIRFVGGQTLAMSPTQFQEGSLARIPLPVGAPCLWNGKEATVERVTQRPSAGRAGALEPYRYRVVTPGGELSEATEEELIPVADARTTDPCSRLASFDIQPYSLFRARETLASAYKRTLRDAAGLKALLGSRIDLRPHQAFAAGTVLLDRRRRYVFADEVGLGKTIEAGIIIADLLAHKPDARILVVCPGALATQWLSELYSKFGGRLFTLLDLHEPLLVQWAKLDHVIASLTLAAYRVRKQLLSIPWDLVVIDEAHHILASPVAYELVRSLSERSPGLLLLSALPTHKREEDLFRLLALLEPDVYHVGVPESFAQFRSAYSSQSKLGAGIRILSRRLEAFSQGDIPASEVSAFAQRLLSLPGISPDPELLAKIEPADKDPERFIECVREFSHELAVRYCFSRRVIRNRRSRLVAQEQIAPITRQLREQPYEPTQLEIDAIDTVSRLLALLRSRQSHLDVVRVFARIAWQAATDPTLLVDLLRGVQSAKAGAINEAGYDLVAQGNAVGHADWTLFRELLFRILRTSLNKEDLDSAIHAAAAWRDFPGLTSRQDTLLKCLREHSAAAPRPKLLVFAGFPGSAARLSPLLRTEFGDDAVVEFRAEQSEQEKEQSVAKFRDNEAVWLLVSDETGGEGRNFQFATELIHFDTSWYAARVEQRIGRLDRLGRERVSSEVWSTVLYGANTPEASAVAVYRDGVGVYTASISGIEFALREIENQLVDHLLADEIKPLTNFATDVRNLSQQEREGDDAEAVLDEASFEQGAASRFRRVTPLGESDGGIEGPFLNYFRALCGGAGVREITESGAPRHTVWRLRPEETRYGALPGDPNGKHPLVGSFDGTFRRDVGQRIPRLQFFNVGNSVFDAVIRSLELHGTARTYAIACEDPSIPPWCGFEFAFTAAPDWSVLQARPGAMNAAERAFPLLPPLRLFIDPDGVFAPDHEVLLRIRRRLDRQAIGQSWSDLSGRPESIAAFLPSYDWQDTIRRILPQAAREAQKQFGEHIQAGLDQELQRLESLATHTAQEVGTTEYEDIRELERALRGWAVRLDGVGFICINQGLERLGRRGA